MDTKTKRSRTITWADPFAIPKATAGKSGLGALREVYEAGLRRPTIAETMDFTGVHVEEGKAIFEGEPAEYLYNPIGVVHGGFAMALLDSAMGCAVHSTMKVGERYTTLEVKTNFVRPITVDTGRVRCEGVVIHRGGTIATAEGKLIAIDSGKLLAHGTTTCLIARA